VLGKVKNGLLRRCAPRNDGGGYLAPVARGGFLPSALAIADISGFMK
jgi:hypothetical protein